MRGKVSGAASQQRPTYTLRAYCLGPERSWYYAGEVWIGTSLITTVREFPGREAALDEAQNELLRRVEDGASWPPGEILRPRGEVRVTAVNERGVVAACWVPEASASDQRQERFAPGFVMESEVR